MSSIADPYIDVAELLRPISDDNPCGEDLKWSETYDEVRRLRNTGDRSMVEGDEAPTAEWHRVIDLTVEALQAQTKDLMLAGWLTEALVHQHAFGGLRDGLRLINGLLSEYWDGVFPRIEDGDIEARLAPMQWLASPDRGPRIPNLLRDLPLAPSDDGEIVFSWHTWNAGVGRASANDDEESVRRKRAEADERRQRFERAVAGASRDYYRRLHAEIAAACDELKTLDRTFDQRFESSAPGTTAFRESLEGCRMLAAQFLKAKGGDDAEAAPDAEPTSDGSAEAGPAAGRASGGGASGPIRDRVDALRRLEEVSAFLRQTEPQSPVPYLIDRAVAWGRMPFHELLEELLADEGTRGQVRDLLGLRNGQRGEGENG